MKRTLRNTVKILAFILFLPGVSSAGWPVFQTLKPDEIMQKVINESCPPGEGQIPAGTAFKIDNKYIPSDQTWYWVYTGTSRCQKMPAPMPGLQYMFYEQNGDYAGGTINTIYGTQNTGPLFRFTFTIPSEPAGWDCAAFAGPQPPTTVGCARDTHTKYAGINQATFIQGNLAG